MNQHHDGQPDTAWHYDGLTTKATSSTSCCHFRNFQLCFLFELIARILWCPAWRCPSSLSGFVQDKIAQDLAHIFSGHLTGKIIFHEPWPWHQMQIWDPGHLCAWVRGATPDDGNAHAKIGNSTRLKESRTNRFHTIKRSKIYSAQENYNFHVFCVLIMIIFRRAFAIRCTSEMLCGSMSHLQDLSRHYVWCPPSLGGIFH